MIHLIIWLLVHTSMVEDKNTKGIVTCHSTLAQRTETSKMYTRVVDMVIAAVAAEKFEYRNMTHFGLSAL